MLRQHLRGNFKALKSCIRQNEKSQISDISFYLKREIDEQMKPKANKLRRGNTKVKVDINEIQNKNKINETQFQVLFFFLNEIIKTDTPLLILAWGGRCVISTIRNERGDITMDSRVIKRIKREYRE